MLNDRYPGENISLTNDSQVNYHLTLTDVHVLTDSEQMHVISLSWLLYLFHLYHDTTSYQLWWQPGKNISLTNDSQINYHLKFTDVSTESVWMYVMSVVISSFISLISWYHQLLMKSKIWWQELGENIFVDFDTCNSMKILTCHFSNVQVWPKRNFTGSLANQWM